jgi:hypothetical protein
MADEPPFARSGASRKGKVIRAPRIVLATDQSEAVRDRLVAELADLKSADDAADWVHKNLAAKHADHRRRRRGRSRIPRKARNDRRGGCRSSGTTAFGAGRKS